MSQQIDLDRHQLKCSSKKEADNNNKHELIIKELENKLSLKEKLIKKIRIENTQKLLEKDKIIEEHKRVIKELQAEYKRQMEMQNKDLQDRMQSMAEKAIAKPSSFNQNTTQIIHNLLPITCFLKKSVNVDLPIPSSDLRYNTD